MENPILHRLRERLNVQRPDPVWLLTLLSVLDLEEYTLEDWNEALSHVAGRRVFCPSYKTLNKYLQELALAVQ